MKTIASGPRARPAPVTGRSASTAEGSPPAGDTIRAAAAEALGTFILVLAITSTAVAVTLARPLAGAPYGSLAVPVAGGLALAVLVAGLGPVSGAHLNPAVTLALAANRRLSWICVPGYLIAQFAGAIAAAATTWALYGNQARTQAGLAAPYPAAGVGAPRVFVAEAIVTFILVLVITSVTTGSTIPPAAAAAAIGSALAAAIVISGPLTGAGVNPARALGPMILTGRFTDWWAYLAAPVIGGTLAVTAHQHLLHTSSSPQANGPAADGPAPT